jgi:hypothetical protein
MPADRRSGAAVLGSSSVPALVVLPVAKYDPSEGSVSLPLSLIDDHRQRHGEVGQSLLDFQAEKQKRKILPIPEIETVQNAFETFDSMIAKGAVVDRLDHDWPSIARVDAGESFEQSEIPFIFPERLPFAVSVVDVDEMKLLGSPRQQFAHVGEAVAQLLPDL